MKKTILKGTILPDILSKAQIDAIDEHLAACEDEHMLTLARADLSGEALKSFNLCAAFKKAEPIVQMLISVLFFKPTWQAALRNLLSVGDALCPVS